VVIVDGAQASKNTTATTRRHHGKPNHTPCGSHCAASSATTKLVELGDVLILHVHHRLQLVDVDLLDVSSRDGHSPCLRQITQRMISTMPWSQQDRAGDRNACLER
jgi:hypothetical protein